MISIPLGTEAKLAQVCIVTNDVEKTKAAYALFLGKEAPPTIYSGDYSIAKTEYMGKPAPDCACDMAIFQLQEGVQLEVIRPRVRESEWGRFLAEHGEGLHHIAFRLHDIRSAVKRCEEIGMKLTQFGYYSDGSGAYAYMDAFDTLKCTVELLEDFK